MFTLTVSCSYYAHCPEQSCVPAISGLNRSAYKHQVSMSTLELAAGEEAVADVASALQQYFADLLSADVDTE